MTKLMGAKIEDLGPPEPVVVNGAASLLEAAETMKRHRIGCLLVSGGGTLCGIITERDFMLKVVGTGVDLASARVEDYMTTDPESLGPDDSIAFALNRMSLGGYRHVPLVDADNRPVGVVSVKDVVDYIVGRFPETVLNLPPEPGVFPGTREGA